MFHNPPPHRKKTPPKSVTTVDQLSGEFHFISSGCLAVRNCRIAPAYLCFLPVHMHINMEKTAAHAQNLCCFMRIHLLYHRRLQPWRLLLPFG